MDSPLDSPDLSVAYAMEALQAVGLPELAAACSSMEGDVYYPDLARTVFQSYGSAAVRDLVRRVGSLHTPLQIVEPCDVVVYPGPVQVHSLCPDAQIVVATHLTASCPIQVIGDLVIESFRGPALKVRGAVLANEVHVRLLVCHSANIGFIQCDRLVATQVRAAQLEARQAVVNDIEVDVLRVGALSANTLRTHRSFEAQYASGQSFASHGELRIARGRIDVLQTSPAGPRMDLGSTTVRELQGPPSTVA